MNQWTYDFEIQTMITMFMNAMSDIIIKRFDVNKQSRDRIKTRVVYAPKQRVINDIMDKDQNLQLPVIACHIGGISRDESRVFNKILGNYKQVQYGNTTHEEMPLAVDLSINVSVVTRYQSDMDQILSHLLPYINPYFTISWRTPGRPDEEIRSNVYWNGSANITYPIDLQSSQVARVVADLSFVFKGWLFKALDESHVGTILTVHSTYNTSFNGIPIEYLLDGELRQTTPESDYILLKGSPPQPKTIYPAKVKTGKPQAFRVFGVGFTNIQNVYLSGFPLETMSEEQKPFAGSITLSSEFIPFSGVKLLSSEWSYDKNHTLSFVMPSAQNVGRLDLIVEGPAGYGTLIQNVRINTFNPFPEDTPEHQEFIPFQFPFLYGIEVFEN